MKNKLLYIAIVTLVLSGCSAVGVPYTSNPYKKIKQAQNLYQILDRPLPAERLIKEAFDIFKKADDKRGLFIANQTYGDFLQSPVVGRWSKMEFFDKSVNHKNRYEKSLEYYQKALMVAESVKDNAAISSAYFSIGRLYYLYFNDKQVVCDSFSKSIDYHLLYRTDYPEEKVILPKGYESFVDYVSSAQKQAECEQR